MPESSTSSPDLSPRHGRVPWAFVGALLLMLLFELALRSRPAAYWIVYQDGADQAEAVRHQIDIAPAPDVAFIGSSMTQQGISVPDVEYALRRKLRQQATVRNFAIRGARIDVFEATIRELLRQKTRPRLIVVGISMRDLREHTLDVDRLSLFWNLSDWWQEAQRAWRERDLDHWPGDTLPQVIRNALGRPWWTLRFRTGIALRLRALFIASEVESMPARGESASEHLNSRRDQKLTLEEFKRPTNKRRMIQAYRPELPAKPPTLLSDRVGRIIEECGSAGVKLMFVDMPISAPLRDLIDNAQRKGNGRDASADFDPQYRATMLRWTKPAGVPFVQGSDLGLQWSNDDFYDAQHLNFSGAKKLGAALVPLMAKQLRAAP